MTILDLPLRETSVPGYGVIRVPRYIVRIDIDDGGAGTHGWQVRYARPWRLISDTQRGKPRSPKTSLRDAKEYLATIFTGVKPRHRTIEDSRKRERTGMPGVRIVRRVHRGRNVAEVLIRVDAPQRSGGRKTIYVGTDNTVTKKRLAEAIRQAKEIRAEFVREFVASKSQ